MESINGFDDFDGCNDDGGALLLEVSDERIGFLRNPTFDRRGLDRGGGRPGHRPLLPRAGDALPLPPRGDGAGHAL